MEAYAIARAAAAARLPVTIVKQVSDEASSEAATSWTESVDECSQHLSAWVRANITL
jgi:nucleoside phosphorylase